MVEAVPLVDIDLEVEEPVPAVLAPVAEPVAVAHGGRVEGRVTPPLDPSSSAKSLWDTPAPAVEACPAEQN